MDAQLIKTVQDLIGFVKDVSPDVWDMLVWQQSVVFISILTALIFCSTGLGVGNWLFFKKDREEIGMPLIIVFGVGLFSCLLVFFMEGIPRLLNPEYYALMALKP